MSDDVRDIADELEDHNDTCDHCNCIVGGDLEREAVYRLRELRAENERLRALLNCRAGKLLLKGKFFLVVANDEPYFPDVYLAIRETEKLAGRWTAEDETAFAEQCPSLAEDAPTDAWPDHTPHLAAYMQLIAKLGNCVLKIEHLQAIALRAWHSFRSGLVAWDCLDGLTDDDIETLVKMDAERSENGVPGGAVHQSSLNKTPKTALVETGNCLHPCLLRQS